MMHLMQSHQMRTTLDLDDDVLLAAKELARRQRLTAGQVISRLARTALLQLAAQPLAVAEPPATYGFRPLPATGRLVTDAMVNQLRDDEGI